MWQMGERNPTDNANRWLFPAHPLFPPPLTLLQFHLFASVPFCFASLLGFALVWVAFLFGLVLSFPGQCGRLLAVAAATLGSHCRGEGREGCQTVVD